MKREDMPSDFAKYLYDWSNAILKHECPQSVADNIVEAFSRRETSVTYLGVYDLQNRQVYRFTHPAENIMTFYRRWKAAWLDHGYDPQLLDLEEGI